MKLFANPGGSRGEFPRRIQGMQSTAKVRARRAKAAPVRRTTLLAADGGTGTKPPRIWEVLSPETQKLVEARAEHREFAAGDVLFRQGDRHDGIFLIQQGLVRSYYVSEEDRELTLGFWGAGHYVGAPQVWGGGTHAWTSEACDRTACLFLRGRDLKQLSATHSDLCMALLEALSHKAECYCALLQVLATSSTKARLGKLLHSLAQLDGGVITLSHAQLASMVGSTRQWISQAVAGFQAEGWIAKGPRGELLVLDGEKLAALK